MKTQPIDRLIESERVNTTKLAKVSGYSRRHIFHVRKGTSNPTLDCMVALRDGLCRMLKRPVTLEELFEAKRTRRGAGR